MGCRSSKPKERPLAKATSLECKIVLLGNSAVGKTSLFTRYCTGNFVDNHDVSIGGSFRQKSVVLDSTTLTLNIWDTAGTERFRSLMPMYYRDALAAIIIFDLTDPESFNACEYWAEELLKARGSECKLILVGNKLDCARQVPKEKALELSRRIKMAYFETSAKTNLNVDLLFKETAALLSKSIT
jgi:Ras-related protein Rab-5C